jgi:hypothetical protein
VLRAGRPADAREHQEVRRAEGARAEHHLTLGSHLLGVTLSDEADTHGTSALEEYAGNVAAGPDRQVRTLRDRT